MTSQSNTEGFTPSAGFDDARWRQRMAESDIADELFLPLKYGDWQGSRFRFLKGKKSEAHAKHTGVRFLAADKDKKNLDDERAVQNDLHRLLSSLMILRQDPAWSDLQLGRQIFRGTGKIGPKRFRFSLTRTSPEQSERRSLSETAVAKQSFRQIRRAISRAGFVVVDPQEAFDPDSGLEGLRNWTDQLRLRRRNLWPWLLLLLPLLFLLPKCEPEADFFGAKIKTRSIAILIDRSSSMDKHFQPLRDEAVRLIDALSAEGNIHANIISYCDHAESCLGGIREIDEDQRAKLVKFLDELKTGGGTNLASAMKIAATEIQEHDQPTTLIVLTDAEDASIAQMIGDKSELLKSFGDVEVHSIALTPRLFGDNTQDAKPNNEQERSFHQLAEILGGRFGAAETTP